MTSFTRIFYAVLGYFLILNSQAKGENLVLDRELAAKLIAEASQTRVKEITVGPMQAVDSKIDSSTTTTSGICVIYIAPVIENGGRRRTVQNRTFFYDKEWGWYLYAIEAVRGGDAIDVVSETKGRIELR